MFTFQITKGAFGMHNYVGSPLKQILVYIDTCKQNSYQILYFNKDFLMIKLRRFLIHLYCLWCTLEFLTLKMIVNLLFEIGTGSMHNYHQHPTIWQIWIDVHTIDSKSKPSHLKVLRENLLVKVFEPVDVLLLYHLPIQRAHHLLVAHH